jgi:hypothetical protein
MGLGPKAWTEARKTLQDLLSTGNKTLEDDIDLRKKYQITFTIFLLQSNSNLLYSWAVLWFCKQKQQCTFQLKLVTTQTFTLPSFMLQMLEKCLGKITPKGFTSEKR